MTEKQQKGAQGQHSSTHRHLYRLDQAGAYHEYDGQPARMLAPVPAKANTVNTAT